jgi:uncharacterized coiled-coil DUF342 family protein
LESRQFEELKEKLLNLKENASRLKVVGRDWLKKRDELKNHYKNLRTEIQKLRNERNKLNEKVKILKQSRTKTKKGIYEKILELKQLNQKLKLLQNKKPFKSLKTLENEIHKIEWKIQTTILNLQEEKELIKQIGELEKKVNIIRNLEHLKLKILELKTTLKSNNVNVKLVHNKIVEIANTSQEIHDKILNKMSKAKKIKTNYNEFHQLHLKIKTKIAFLKKEISNISFLVKQKNGELRKEEKKEKEKKRDVYRKELEKKYNSGEKITWQEFKLITQE